MSPPLRGSLVLVGAGKMGGAMVNGWLHQGMDASRIVVLDPAPPPESLEMIEAHGISHNPDIAGIADPEVVLIAVKPQTMDQVLPAIAPLAAAHPMFVSIAAGTMIATFEAAFGRDAAVVRAMPNTPAAVGYGMTVICPNANCSQAQAELATVLLQAVGAVARIDDEGLLDAVTAVSGSGPAYVFLLAESMTAAGMAAGLPEDLAAQLARTTVHGAGELLRQSELPAATLRANVTSPGGTTAAALEVLRAEGGMPNLLLRAVAAAARRGRELAG